MEDLNSNYISKLDAIKAQIQKSEELAKFLDEEEDEDYKALVEKYEGSIHELYEQVANENPLQLIAFENHLLNEEFEGLYLPKALGYSVLRGRINKSLKYYRPQNHFKSLLENIINSSNFEQIKQRIGQSIQIGYALSSDIWITNIHEAISNKKVKSFLQSQKLLKYREEKLRNTALVKFRKQFQSLNFQTAKFPESKSELLLEAGSLKDFLIYRSKGQLNNENLIPVINKLISNEEFFSNKDFFDIAILLGLHYTLDQKGNDQLTQTLSQIRQNNPDAITEEFFTFLNAHSEDMRGLLESAEKNLSQNIDRPVQDGISAYFNMLDIVINLGYIHNDAISAVREYYYKNEGLSIENEAIRKSIRSKLGQLLLNVEVTDYNEYFEINKTFIAYMDIFSNQKFNQDLKGLSLKYVGRCLKHFKDKRSKEYQEIKKFVKISFVDYGFMTEKQVAEIFKTKRKPKTS